MWHRRWDDGDAARRRLTCPLLLEILLTVARMSEAKSGAHTPRKSLRSHPGDMLLLSCALPREKLPQLRHRLRRRLIHDVMPGGHAFARDVGCVVAPDRERIVVLAAEASRAPQHERRTGDLALAIGLVV